MDNHGYIGRVERVEGSVPLIAYWDEPEAEETLVVQILNIRCDLNEPFFQLVIDAIVQHHVGRDSYIRDLTERLMPLIEKVKGDSSLAPLCIDIEDRLDARNQELEKQTFCMTLLDSWNTWERWRDGICPV